MQKDNRAITKEQASALLNKMEHAVLLAVVEDGKYYGVLLSFGDARRTLGLSP
jgi:hypothetical protein